MGTPARVAIAVALIGAISAIAAAVITSRPKPPEQTTEYVGRVADAATTTPIRGAKVSLQLEGAPPVALFTDSEGVYKFNLSGNPPATGRVVVEAAGFQEYDRFVPISVAARSVEDIRLQPASPRAPAASPTPARTVLYRADFDQWSELSDDCNRKFYVEAERAFHIWAAGCPRQVISSSLINRSFTEFEVEARATKADGSDRSWYGLAVVRRLGGGEEEQHWFLVSGIGNYVYRQFRWNREQGSVIGLDDAAPISESSSVRRRGTANILRVAWLGPTVEFHVNGERLFSRSTNLSRAEDVQIGIAVHLDRNEMIEAGFADLVVYRP